MNGCLAPKVREGIANICIKEKDHKEGSKGIAPSTKCGATLLGAKGALEPWVPFTSLLCIV